MSTLYDDMKAWDVPQLIAAIKGRDDSIDALSAELNEYKVNSLPPALRTLCSFPYTVRGAHISDIDALSLLVKSRSCCDQAEHVHRHRPVSPTILRCCFCCRCRAKMGGSSGSGASGDAAAAQALSFIELKELRAKVAEQAIAIADLKAKLEASVARADKLQRELQMGRSVKQVEEDEANAFAED